MNPRRGVSGTVLLVTVVAAACLGDRVVAPGDPLLPALLAVDRPNVHLFRYAMGRKVEDTVVVITNNGDGPLGTVEQVGGVDYLSARRTGWLSTRLDPVGTDTWQLHLSPTYDTISAFTASGEVAIDTAEVVLKAL